jgi:hypothetical protein
MILEKGHRNSNKIVFDTDPKALVTRVIEMVHQDKEHHSTFRFEKETLRKKNLQ